MDAYHVHASAKLLAGEDFSFTSNVARNIVKEVLENLLVIILDFFFFQKRMLKMYILDTNVHASVLLESFV